MSSSQSPPAQVQAATAEYDPSDHRTPAHFLFTAVCPFMMEYNPLPVSSMPSTQCACGHECGAELSEDYFVLGSETSPHYRANGVTVESVWEAGTLVCHDCLFSVRCGLGLHPWTRHPTLEPRDDPYDSMGVAVKLHGPLRPPTVFYPARTMRVRVVPEPKPSRLDTERGPPPRVLYSSDDEDEDEDSVYESSSSPTSGSETVAPSYEDDVAEGIMLMKLSAPTRQARSSSVAVQMPKVGPPTQGSRKRRRSSGSPLSSGTKRVQKLNGPGYFIVSASDCDEDVDDLPHVLFDDDIVVPETQPSRIRLTPTPPGGWISTRNKL